MACQENQLDCVKFLAKVLCNLNGPTIHGITPLKIAVLKDLQELVKHLLQVRAAIRRVGEPAPDIADRPRTTPLLLATQEQHLAMVTILLQENADPNEVNHKGCSPLIKACQKNSLEIAATLLESGALVDHAADDGATSLQILGCRLLAFGQLGMEEWKRKWKLL